MLYGKLHAAFDAHGKMWKGCVDRLWAVGPKGVNNNILVNNIPGESSFFLHTYIVVSVCAFGGQGAILPL